MELTERFYKVSMVLDLNPIFKIVSLAVEMEHVKTWPQEFLCGFRMRGSMISEK